MAVPWVPASADRDCDGYSETPNDPFARWVPCAQDTTGNNEKANIHAWPPDVNDNQVIGLSDIGGVTGHWGGAGVVGGPTPPYPTPHPYWDVNANGATSISDLGAITGKWGAGCSSFIPTAPYASTSYYVAAAAMETSGEMAYMGCVEAGSYNGARLAALVFGQPAVDSTGTYAYPATFVDMDAIGTAVEEYVQGFVYCAAGSDFVCVSMSTLNQVDPNDNGVTQDHGAAWGDKVIALNVWLASGSGCSCSSRAGVLGGDDIEVNWGSYTDTSNWKSGYTSVMSDAGYDIPWVDLQAAESCPTDSSSGTAQCANSNFTWTVSQVHTIASGYLAWVVPQIYHNDGSDAARWRNIAGVATPVTAFKGAISEWQACEDNGNTNPECYGFIHAKNKPSASWQQLWVLINGDLSTGPATLSYSTNIRWNMP